MSCDVVRDIIVLRPDVRDTMRIWPSPTGAVFTWSFIDGSIDKDQSTETLPYRVKPFLSAYHGPGPDVEEPLRYFVYIGTDSCAIFIVIEVVNSLRCKAILA